MDVDKAGDDGEVALVVATRGHRNSNFVASAHGGDLLAIYQDNGIGNLVLRRESTTRENGLQSHRKSSYWKSCAARQ
jgi:hypothetical protein